MWWGRGNLQTPDPVPCGMTPVSGAIPVQTEPTPRWWPWVRVALVAPLVVLPALLLLPPVLKLPVYTTEGGTLTARSLAARTVIPAGTPVTTRPVRLSGKVIGSALPGYTVGRFRTAGGPVSVYSDGSHTRSALVFATTPPTVLTPADPQALIRAWQTGQTAQFRPARAAGFDWTLLLLLPLLPVVALLMGRPRVHYRLEGHTLVVKTAVSTLRFSRDRTQATLTRVPLGMRLFGTAMPGYYTGTFSSNAGTGGRVQGAAGASRPDQAVLLTTGGRQYYLTPADPQGLVSWFGAESAPDGGTPRSG